MPASSRILAIDPGSTESAWLLMDGLGPLRFGIDPNEKLLDDLRHGPFPYPDVVAIERVESFGMPVGAEVFETVRWAGRFEEACYPTRVVLVTRQAVKLALCHDTRAKDPNIRRALLDGFGGDGAKGTKAHPGPLYGVSRDVRTPPHRTR
jgi:hypothetical protein